MFVFDFFDKEKILETLASFYDLDDFHIPKKLGEIDVDSVREFIDINKLNLEKDVNDVFLKCRHFTTAITNNDTFNKYGLLTLDKALEKDTDLNNFLQENGVHFDIVNKKMYYNNYEIDISEDRKDCNNCFDKIKNRCRESRNIEQLLFGNTEINECLYHNLIDEVYNPIYYWKGEIEGFLYKEIPYSAEGYSGIEYYPEILEKIDKVINDIFDENINLCGNWMFHEDKHNIYIDFKTNIFNFENTTISLTDGWDDLIEEYISILNIKEPSNFKYNFFLIINSITAHYCNTEKIFQLKRGVKISPNEITISPKYRF